MNIPVQDFVQSAEYDQTLETNPRQITAIKKKYLRPVLYSQKVLFENMMKGTTVVFKDYPIKLQLPKGVSKRDYLISILNEKLPAREKILIRTGKSHTPRRVTIREALQRWQQNRSRFGVTDLHFRNTRFYDSIDADAISYFNILPSGGEDISTLEMLTLVISSTGIFSDSHSDDGDGSNHCFVGKKLWLAWDRQEGRQVGLEDCTFDPVYSQAKFSINKFLKLPSAHWFVVSENRTLFMPGNFAHKVVTLEPYIGFGSFYVSLPNYVNSIKRWVLLPTGDVDKLFLSSLNKHLLKLLTLQGAGQRKIKTGLPYFKLALKNWKKGLSDKQIKRLEEDSEFSEFRAFAKTINSVA